MKILDYVNKKFEDINEEVKLRVTLDRFSPVEKLAYGFAGLVLTGAVIAILSLIYK